MNQKDSGNVAAQQQPSESPEAGARAWEPFHG